MFKNYLKIALRNIWKNKVFSAINIVGLAIGLASCIIILVFVAYENSFDKTHSRNIYRLDEVQKFEGMVAPQKVALSMFPMGPTLKNDFPEIKNFVRVRKSDNTTLDYQNKKYKALNGLMVDENFLEMFDFELLEGKKNAVLSEPNTIVLTEDFAKGVFGNQNPIGQSLARYANDTIVYKVTGILKNTPANSHLQFDVLYSFKTIIRPQMMDNWGGNWLVTYLELADGADVAGMEKKFPGFLVKRMGKEGAKNYELFLQPLPEVHSSSTDITHDYMNYQKFDKSYTYIFFVIAAIVLVIACVNFMNLSTARSMGRAREVGVRKSIGAQRAQLAIQFIGESVLLSFISLILAVLLVKLLLPSMSDFSQRKLEFNFFTNPGLAAIVLSGTMLIGILSGLYPAGFLSGFEPVKVLKGTFKTSKSNFRNILVVAQFASAIILMIGTGFAVKQLRFMQDKDPGFVREQVVLIPLNFKSDPKFHALKDQFLASSVVESVSGSGQRLGNNLHQTGVNFYGDGPMKSIASSQVVVDPDYLTLYKIKILAGRNFQDTEADNAKTYIVNESLAKELLKDQKVKTYESLIGKRFGFGGMDSLAKIVGVAQDFNFNSLHNKIETLCIFNQKDWGYNEMSVRINGKDARKAIETMKMIWKEQLPDEPFEYSYLDAHFEEMYRADDQVSEIVGILAGLAIFVSCLGLFGLASYSAERRTKEIGVRKVMGASVAGMVALLSRDFLKLVLIAILIAIPVAWWAVSTWLKDFAYRIDIDAWIFLLTALLAVSVAFLTVSFQSIKAALVNPVKSLRSE